MRRQQIITYGALLTVWILFSLWQYHGFVLQDELIRATVYQPSRAIMTVLLGGIRSHRRVTPYLDEQVQNLLNGLVDAGEVLAAAVVNEAGDVILAAGKTELLGGSVSGADGATWDPGGFRLAQTFELESASGGLGQGLGMGPGSGRGRGFGFRQRIGEPEGESRFTAGATYQAVLVLNRGRADAMGGRAVWTCISSVVAAAAVAICLALVWHATMRLVEARGRAHVNEMEMRHLRELSQAAAGLAHETRNPLGVIRGWTQRLAGTEMPAGDRSQVAQTVLEECDRVTARINQFLMFARPREPQPAAVAVAPLADELRVILQPDLEARHVRFETDIAPAAATVWADSDLLRQTLFNLLQNAIEFSPSGQSIQLTAQPARDGTVTLTVTDRGGGVEPELVKSLFTPYFTTRPNGTGLGLAIVRHIVRLHGWEVQYEPRPTGGSRFHIRKIHVTQPHHSDR